MMAAELSFIAELATISKELGEYAHAKIIGQGWSVSMVKQQLRGAAEATGRK